MLRRPPGIVAAPRPPGLRTAAEHAAQRMEELRELGAHTGAATWGRIRAALLDLCDIKFSGDEVQ